MKTALISGISGQDGAYLSKLLINNGYRVVGITRSYNSSNTKKLDFLGISGQVIIEECDLTDFSSILRVITQYKPDEIYNLAAQSSVALSFSQPIGTINFNVSSVLNILEAIRIFSPNSKFYQASSSEMFGHVTNLPIAENTYLNPLSPYAISKATAHWLVKSYRDSYGVFACSGILFNHESYLRDENFFVKKVIRSAVRISQGKQDLLKVGNIDIKRDFGYSPEYVKAMHLMLQADKADDFVICSGKSVYLREIVGYVFNHFGIPMTRLVIDDSLYRPAEIIDIYGSNAKAAKHLGWEYSLDFFDVLDVLIREETNGQD